MEEGGVRTHMKSRIIKSRRKSPAEDWGGGGI